MNAEYTEDGVIKLITDKKLKNNIIKYLNNEKGNIKEIEKFYKLIDIYFRKSI